MRLIESEHWKKKRKYRKDITNDMIEYAIQNSNELKDKYLPMELIQFLK